MSRDGPEQSQPREGIAIVGMASLFAGAPNVDAFWRNIINKFDAVSDAPPGSLEAAAYDPDSTETDRIYCRRGGFIESMARFDPLQNGVPPVAVGGDPDQWLALQIARDALSDAGYSDLDERVRHRTAVILGRGAIPNAGTMNAIQHGLMVTQTIDMLRSLHPELSEHELSGIRTSLKAQLPPMSPENAAGYIPNLIAGRIANRLDLMGPNYTLDAACASSLVAVQIAVRELREGTCDLALAGGSHVWTPLPMLSIFSQLGALSRTERIRPFDKDADGTLLGEGLGMVVLKRLQDAERDGDRIYAVVRSVGISSDGRAVGVMAPRLEGQELALSRAYAEAGVEPGSVGLIEAHGTGTALGDLTEIQALAKVFGPRVGEQPNVGIGTVKSMISHTVPAAGVAGVIKTALALHHKVLPPTLHCDEPNPKFELERTPFFINTATRPWFTSDGSPRRAGVSAFGFGGINAHAVLEEHVTRVDLPALGDHRPEWDSELCVITAPTRDGLIGRATSIASALEPHGEDSGIRLQDVAWTLIEEAGSRSLGEALKLAVVAESLTDLVRKLRRAAQRLADPACHRIQETAGIYFASNPLAKQGKVAFLFPGEGSQYTDMLADLCLTFPEVREAFEATDTLHRQHGRTLVPTDYIFPRTTFSERDRAWAAARLQSLDGALSAVLTADAAMLCVLQGLEIRPEAVLGHSAGEQAAMLAAGVYGESAGLAADVLMEVNAKAGEGTGSANLIAFGASREEVEAMLAAAGIEAEVIIDNCPHQVVVVLAELNEAKALDTARANGVITERLPFDRAYHTPNFAPFSELLDGALTRVKLSPPRVPVYSCMTAGPVGDDPAAIAAAMSEQWRQPVEFRRTIERMHADGFRLFIEVGPRNHLTAFVEDNLRGKEFAAVATNVQRRSGVLQINHVAALLAAHGVEMNLGYLHGGRLSRVLDLAALPAKLEGPPGLLLKTGFPVMTLTPADLPASLPSRRLESMAPDTAWPDFKESSLPLPDDRTPEGPTIVAAQAEVNVQPHPTQPAGADMAAVANRFLDTMDRFLAVQESVMRAYLEGVQGALPSSSEGRAFAVPAPAPASLPPPPVSSAPDPVVVAVPPAAAGLRMAVEVTPAAAPDAGPLLLGRWDELAVLLVEIVSDRTGYPADIIRMDADLEADLGIDSIKRVEILGTLRQKVTGMDRLDLEVLTPQRTLQQVIDVLKTESARLTSPATSVTVALTNGAHAAQPASSVPPALGVIELTLDPSKDSWLRDHTLGRYVSHHDASLLALPVVPLAFSIELMIRACLQLAPALVVTRIENVVTNRWIGFDTGPQTVRASATRDTNDPTRVRVEVSNLTEEAVSPGPLSPAVEAVMVLAETYAVPPAPLAPRTERPSDLQARTVYEDILFHGKSWQAVDSIESTGPEGAVGCLVTPRRDAFGEADGVSPLLDAILLDGAAQVLGCWAHENLAEGAAMLPIAVEAVDIYGPSPSPGARLKCVLAVEDSLPHLVRARMDLIAPSGIVMRIQGWVQKRFELPAPLASLARPRALPNLTRALSLDDLAPELSRHAEARVLDVELPADAAFLARVWASRIFSARERLTGTNGATAREALERLAGLHAAKEAIIALLGRTEGLDLLPADVELLHVDGSRYEARVPVGRSPDAPITVWWLHDQSFFAALAAKEPGLVRDAELLLRTLIVGGESASVGR